MQKPILMYVKRSTNGSWDPEDTEYTPVSHPPEYDDYVPVVLTPVSTGKDLESLF